MGKMYCEIQRARAARDREEQTSVARGTVKDVNIKVQWLNNVVLVYLLMHQFLLGKMYCEIQRTASGSIVRACARSNPSRETAKDANIKVQPPI